jgi:hypothetical protein
MVVIDTGPPGIDTKSTRSVKKVYNGCSRMKRLPKKQGACPPFFPLFTNGLNGPNSAEKGNID